MYPSWKFVHQNEISQVVRIFLNLDTNAAHIWNSSLAEAKLNWSGRVHDWVRTHAAARGVLRGRAHKKNVSNLML